ncbi:UNVERIFIED_CONTAM: putative hydrolase rbbp9 [Siphonaria sp. JEL0065]|nr:putative hydrolase rbbp9 [Siphonaria sp. JEL0065]
MPKTRVLLVPGNGCGGDIRPYNFYGWAEAQLEDNGFEAVLPGPYGMPDPVGAKRSIWIPHIQGIMKCDADSVLVGHSSGAAAALRYAEEFKIKGLVLVAAYDDALGDDNEQASGYFDGPFNWEKIKENCEFIVQFAGKNDCLVPIDVQRRVRDALLPKVVYIEDPEGDHFFEPPFDELILQIKKRSSGCTK